jgi:prevent-host-death family protein
MGAMSLAEVKAQLSAVVERVQAGETVQITKRGKPVAEISPLPRPLKKIDVAALERHAKTLPYQEEDSGTFIRRMRDEARY